MEAIQNVLYVMTQGAYLHRDHETVHVEVEKKRVLSLPFHVVESIVLFGNVLVSPYLLGACAERQIAISFMTEHGNLLARVDAPGTGNVLLRREQFRRADQPQHCTEIASRCVVGKLQNCRQIVLRAARDAPNDETREQLQSAAQKIAYGIRDLPSAQSVDSVRGHEGNGARIYFGNFNLLLRQQNEDFKFTTRNRYPPLDRINALLSYTYTLLLHDCVAACTAAGLDPSVGYLHTDRPGRPSLALDLMEEFRPILADRMVLALINRKQVSAKDFELREGGAVEMKKDCRKLLVATWQQRKQETIHHPVLEHQAKIGLLPFLQARLMARYLRGDLPQYLPCVLK